MINRCAVFFLTVLVSSGNAHAFFGFFNGNYDHRKVIYREPLKEGSVGKYALNGSLSRIYSDFQSRYGSGWNVKLDKVTLSPMMVSGKGISMLEEGTDLRAVENASRRFIDENREFLKIGNQDLVLNLNLSKNAGAAGEMWFVHFMQFYNGIPVLDSDVFFRFKFGRLVQFGSEAFPGIDIDTRPSVSARDAVSRAQKALDYREESDRIVSQGELFIYPILQGGRFHYKLAYKNVILKSDPYGEWVVYVDANDGGILEKYSNIYYFEARLVGSIHPRLADDRYMDVPLQNVIVNIEGIEESLTDHKGMFGARFDNVTNISMSVGGPFAVSKQCDTVYVGGGLYTRCDGTATRVTFDADSGWGYDGLTFSLDDTNTTSAERDSFFYVTRAVNWAARFIRPKWFGTKLGINVNIKEMVEKTLIGERRKRVSCNAFWDGKTINFFVGGQASAIDPDIQCNNAANIADIVLHEWGHGLDDNTGGIDDVVFSEGIADTVAFIMTGDSRIGLSFFKEPHESTGGTFIRDVSVKKVYPKDKDSDPHIESLIISGAWWDLRNSLMERYGFMEGNDRTSYLFLNHILTARKYTQSYSAALVIDDDDGDLANGTPNSDLIRAAFAEHGLALD